jgi:hypothetical protein
VRNATKEVSRIGIPGTVPRPIGTRGVRCPLLVALGLLAATSIAFVPRASAEFKLFASWHAPYGEPGATDTLTSTCNDKGADTLYLSVDPADTVQALVGLRGVVAFHTAPQDTFSDRWKFGGGPGNEFNVRMEPGPDESFHTLMAWTTKAMGGVRFEHTTHHGFLRFLLAQSDVTPTRLEPGKRYCIARLLIPHPPEYEGCHQPICIEFQQIKITIDRVEVPGSAGTHRFLSFNSPDGVVCSGPKNKTKNPEVWVPGNH